MPESLIIFGSEILAVSLTELTISKEVHDITNTSIERLEISAFTADGKES